MSITETKKVNSIINTTFNVSKKIGVVGLIIITVVIVMNIILALYFVASLYISSNSYTTRDISNYRVFNSINGEERDLTNKLDIFPERISDSNNVSEYYYEAREILFDNSYEMYLEMSYSEEEYMKEIDRLASIKGVKDIAYNESDFNYPAYVSIYASDNKYEYALLDKENSKIIYIYTAFQWEKDIDFKKEYLPKNFMPDTKGQEEFIIYY